jgi:hypothetical protein
MSAKLSGLPLRVMGAPNTVIARSFIKIAAALKLQI